MFDPEVCGLGMSSIKMDCKTYNLDIFFDMWSQLGMTFYFTFK